MGHRTSNLRDKDRTFETLAKVDASGVVVAMVEVDSASDWQHVTDGEGHRYVYLEDLLPVAIDGMQLLPDLET